MPLKDMPEADVLRKLRLTRAQLKGTVTRIENFINDPKNSASATTEMLQARIEKLNVTFKDYEKVQLDILLIDESDSENVEILEDKYFYVISKLNATLRNLNVTEVKHCTNVSTSKLPNIDIPVFTGKDFSKYHPFMDLFLAVIHKNSSLSDVQKLFYLRKFLADEALSVIVNLPLVNESYKEAIELLKKRFDNKARLISSHINLILQLPSMQKGTATSIRSFISQVQQQLHALKNLQQPVEHWDMLLITILTKKLDQYTNRAYQLDRNSDTLPTIQEFMSFLERRSIALEDSEGTSDYTKSTSKVSNVVTKNTNNCTYCKGNNHAIHACPKFKTSPIADREKFVQSHNLCNICLKSHAGKCKFTFTCKICKSGHNTLLHSDACSAVQPPVTLHSIDSSVNVVLPTIRVRLFDRKGTEYCVRALLDSGSQTSFITTSLVEKLCLKVVYRNTNVIGIGNKSKQINKQVKLVMHSPVNNAVFETKCHVVDTITSPLPQTMLNISNLNIPKGIQLSDNDFNVPTQISILLGADIYFNILLKGQIKIPNGPLLQETMFGYTIGGNVCNQNYNSNEQLVSNLAICDSKKLEDVMEQFWFSESVPQAVSKNKTCSEFQKAEKCLVKLENNKFCVDMPLTSKISELQLGDSFSVAFQRFLALERKFKNDKFYLEKYKNFINEYLALGHAREVDIGIYDIHCGSVYFLAHHAVFNDESLTTKIRVVFDGSMKSRSGVSVNDVMLNGPVLQSELFDILILWRTFPFTLTCDIQKMFRNILINPEQTSLQNILWRDDPNKPISCLQLQTVTYGLKSSTFLATRCLIELARIYKDEYPLAAQAMLLSTYVDDIICGADTEAELLQLKTELISLLNKGGFTLHKWCSNNPQTLSDLPSDKKYFDKLDINKNNIAKTLGLKCDVINDRLTFSCPVFNDDEKLTKRKVLSFIGKMFDPLGLIGPIIVVAKLFMQTLWSMNTDWDTILPHEKINTWLKYLTSLKLMGTISVPRCVNSNNPVTVELVGYSDASMKAYGCCLYLRMISPDGSVSVNLLCSKSRVAPLNKNITIPKLELNGSLLLAQVVTKVQKILHSKFPGLSIHLYSDSQITLAWIKSSNLKSNPYVERRVSQIKQLLKETGPTVSWSYISTLNNPSDLISRGCEPHKLQSNTLWWHGPIELLDKNYQHPKSDGKLPISSSKELVTSVCHVDEHSASSAEGDVATSEFYNNFSNLGKLKRIVAYILRFRKNCSKNSNRVGGPLTPQELNNALLVVIRRVQAKSFAFEINCLKNDKSNIKSGLASLHPFLDKDGTMRVGGRLQNATNLPYDKKHPIILPKSCHFTNILIQNEHLRLLHAGAKLVLSSLSQTFWLISGIREVKKVVNKCVRCFRMKAAASKQLMGSLPSERLSAVRAFNVVGVDFCGPFSVKVSRLRKPIITKGYVALFVCFSTKAIHMELVSDLTTQAFLACLKRFVARRGLPNTIYCDNAKTFKGAANELKELYSIFVSKTHKDVIESYCLNNSIKFKFIPSYSPEFGGLWEAGVKSFKYHFKRIVGNISLTFEGMYTVIAEIEAVLNSRPLLPMSSDVSDFKYLTPGHFLIGTAMTSHPEISLSDKSVDRLKFWNVLTKIKQDFWKIWFGDYLTQLQNRPKWHNVHPNLKVGDLVIVRNDNTPPLTWPMARIVKTIAGPDGNVRVAEIKLPNNKIYTRSLRKLSPLPLN